MRQGESHEELPPEAIARIEAEGAAEVARLEAEADERKAKKIRLYSGLVIAGAGLLAVFTIDGAVYVGFATAMVGTKMVPLSEIPSLFKK